MEIAFLGGASTVTGSRFLLTTARAQILIDCGMFQGSPNESIRNRIPFAYEPRELDAVLLTHAHLDHCGLLPLLVKDGYRGPIHATAGTIELASLVLLDSGKLHEEFAKREARWEKRHPDKVEADDRREADQYEAAVELATAGETLEEHVPTSVEPAAAPAAWPRDPEADLRAQPPKLDIDLDAPLYTGKDAELSLARFSPVRYDEEVEVAPGIRATFFDAGHILGSAIIRLRVQDAEGGEERVIVCSGDLGRRPVAPPPVGARPQQAPIRARLAAVSVDDAPDGCQRLEQRPSDERIGFGREAGQDREPMQGLAADAGRRGGLAVASVQGRAQPSDRRVLFGDAACGRDRAGRRLELVEPLERALHVGQRPGVLGAGRRSGQAGKLAVEGPPPAPISARQRTDRSRRRVDGLATVAGDDDVTEGRQEFAERPLDRREVHRPRIRGRWTRSRAVAVTMRPCTSASSVGPRP